MNTATIVNASLESAIAAQLCDLTSVSPSSAADALLVAIARPAGYAVAIIAQGKQYLTSVCAALNTLTEGDRPARQAAQGVLNNAADRHFVGFCVKSSKTYGLSVADCAERHADLKAKKEKAAAAPAPAADASEGEKTDKPAAAPTGKDAIIAKLTQDIASLTSERDALSVRVADLTASVESTHADNVKLQARINTLTDAAARADSLHAELQALRASIAKPAARPSTAKSTRKAA